MTAHLFFVSPSQLAPTTAAGTRVILDGDEGRHAATVKRMQVGEDILLADGDGLLAEAVVDEVGKGELTARINHVAELPKRDLRFTLVQALAKGDRDLQAVESAVELGIDEVIPWQAERSIVQWKGERAAKAHKKWVALAASATKQSRQARIPAVGELVTKKTLAEKVSSTDLALLLHEDAEVSITDVDLPERGEVALIVGPEGGMSDDEVAALRSAGAKLVRMGDSVLRSSSAGPAAFAALLSCTRWRTMSADIRA